MDIQGPGSGRWSSGMAFQLLLGLGLIVILIILTGVTALMGLHQLLDGLQTVVDDQIQELVLATQVDRQSAALVAEAPNLALASNNAQRRYSLRRLQDQLQLLREPSQRLHALNLVDRSLIDEIFLFQDNLRDNILELDRLVQERNQTTEQHSALINALNQYRQRLDETHQRLQHRQLRQERRPWNLLWDPGTVNAITPLWHWLSYQQERLVLTGVILSTEQDFRLTPLEVQQQNLLTQQQQIEAIIDPVDRSLLYQLLPAEDSLLATVDPIALQRRSLISQRLIRGLLAESNRIADTLLGATANLVQRVRSSIDQQNQRNSNTIKRLYQLGLLATLVATLLSLLAIVFIDRRILKRLRNFQQTLQGLTLDPGKARTILVQGNDEIAAMARSFEQLLVVIQAREQALRDNEERLQNLARQDALTGLPNRHHFFEMAHREINRSLRSGEPLAVMMLDVDHFKTINDTHGHATGDYALKTMSQQLCHLVRGHDMVGRLGGEEFAVLLPQTDRIGAMDIAERLRQGLADLQLHFDGRDIPLTVSIGVAQYQPMDHTIDQALNRADHALYRAKRAGRNRVMHG